MEGNYKDAEKERDDLKKSTQAKFMKLTNNHKSGEKLVRFSQILLSLSMFTCFAIKDKEAEDIVSKLSTLKQEEKERVKSIKNYENEIIRCEAEIAKPSPPDLGTIEQCKDDTVCIPSSCT